MRVILRNMVLWAVALHGGNVFAACSSQYNIAPIGTNPMPNYIPAISDTALPGIAPADFNAVVDNKNIPIGGVLDSRTVTITASPYIYCTPATATSQVGTGVSAAGALGPSYNNVYQTNLAGVGVRISGFMGNNTAGAGLLIPQVPGGTGPSRYVHPTLGTMFTIGTASSALATMIGDTKTYFDSIVHAPVGIILHGGAGAFVTTPGAPRDIRYYVELIKLSNTIDGGILSGTAHTLTAGGSTVLQINFGGKVIPVTGCTIQTPNVSRSLDPVSVDTLRTASIGSQKSFQLIFDCKPGTQVNMTANAGTTVQSSLIGVIGLTPNANAAQGVGIQILKSDGITPIPLGQEQLYSASTPNGIFTVDMNARYVRIADAIAPGKADGTVTFTVRYL